MKNVFPVVMIVLQFLASATYLFNGDWKRGVYWMAASVLTLCVTL
jgi:hypothetical protein